MEYRDIVDDQRVTNFFERVRSKEFLSSCTKKKCNYPLYRMRIVEAELMVFGSMSRSASTLFRACREFNVDYDTSSLGELLNAYNTLNDRLIEAAMLMNGELYAG